MVLLKKLDYNLSMNKVFVRNFVLFIFFLLLCAGTLCYSLIRGERELDTTDDLVMHTYHVITQAEQLSTLIEGMLASQRGFLLTSNEEFSGEYERKKALISEHIASLSNLTKDNESQKSRLDEVRAYFNQFSSELESRIKKLNATKDRVFLEDVETIDSIRDNIIRINTAILNEENNLLQERVLILEKKKREYFYTLLIGIIIGTILLLLFNGFLFRAQAKRSLIEETLKDSEKRFAIAIEGTQDGIFDWDIRTNTVFYSQRFFEMLGYPGRDVNGTYDDFKQYLHPDDAKNVENYIKQYLDGAFPEYVQEFRMKHKSGRWIWIQSRAKVLMDRKGEPYRMVGAHTDITHLIKAQEKLEAEKEEAESANRAKSDFLAHMSHEIRTPLTAISGIAEIMQKRQNKLDESQKQLVSTLNSSSSALKDLVNDILDFSKIESRELELDEELFLLEDLIHEVISMMSLRANEKGISFLFDYNEVKNAEFYGDKKRVRQILSNLIGNAVKFTDTGGVTVKAFFEDRKGGDFLRVDVTDTGIGIASEDFDLIFERFKQADSSVSRKYGGTGLGLPISKNLAELMDGDIFLSSQAKKGSTFSLILPQKVAHEGAKRMDQTELTNKLNDKIQAFIHDECKVLIVEDYEGNVVVLSSFLEDIGLEYEIARTGLEAVNAWKTAHYDVILMDVQMPEMDGFAATSEIRRIEEEQSLDRTPIIGMTAHALVGDKSKCIEAGMDAYLSKPIVENDLKREILTYLDSRKCAA